MSADEKRIREFAYQIWESEGRPNGHDKRHWEMARKLAEAEALAPDKSTARKASKPKLPKVDSVADALPQAASSAAKDGAASKPAVKAVPRPATRSKTASAPTPAGQPAKPAVKKPRKPAAP